MLQHNSKFNSGIKHIGVLFQEIGAAVVFVESCVRVSNICEEICVVHLGVASVSDSVVLYLCYYYYSTL